MQQLLSIPIARVLSHYGFPIRGKREKVHLLCPFHKETSPSFLVNLDKNFCYCFGCSKSWDSIELIREFDGCSFLDALQKLCEIGRFKKLAESDLGKIVRSFKRVRTEVFTDQQARAYHAFILRVADEFSEYYHSLSTWKNWIYLIEYIWQEFDQIFSGKSTRRKFDEIKDWFHTNVRVVKNTHEVWRKLPVLKNEAWFDRVDFKNGAR